MRKLLFITFYLVPLFLFSQQEESRALFIENDGQWEEDFSFKLPIINGSMFFENSGYTLLLVDPDMIGHSDENHEHHHHGDELIQQHSIKMEFVNANINPTTSGEVETHFYHNYMLGRDQSNWRSNVGVFRQIRVQEIYPNIDVTYYGDDEDLKYDFIVKPGGDSRLIQMRYTGADIKLKRNRLHIKTAFGDLIEVMPSVYQVIEGEKVEIQAFYDIHDNIISFDIGSYNTDYELIIDPKLIFSSFSGSTARNFGFTATYDLNGYFYGGGIVFNLGGTYPTSTGAFQSTFQGASSDFDIGISKFNEQGDQLLFSTFLGGNNYDLPQSLVVDDQNNLFILGATSSDNFPIPTTGSFQGDFEGGPVGNGARGSTFPLGTDIFISCLSADGGSLLASTYVGGVDNDGMNFNISENYGDNARGEIIYDNGNVYIISSSQSPNIKTSNSIISQNHGAQDAFIASFSEDLTSMNWGTFFGGSGDESGYSLKVDNDHKLFVSGSTNSTDMPFGLSSILSTHQGGLDGYLAKFDAHDGSLIEGTYVGTSGKDQCFFVDLDKAGNPYVVGQSDGAISISANIYANSNSRQFLKKFDKDLNTEIWSTQIGSARGKYDLVPTAFMVDDCYNIYLSGWNGESNKVTTGGSALGNTFDLPVTSDAVQTTTDGSDFYFMVFDRDAKNLEYASYYGGAAEEHVDGGTSRFNPNGSIFQAVCAGCGGRGFPTTPGAYSVNNPSNGDCNLGVIKFDFEITVRSKPEIDFDIDTDIVCDSLRVKFTNSSVNANVYNWDFGNGSTSQDVEPSTSFTTFGTYTIQLIALDTNCGIADTSYVTINHLTGQEPKASFQTNYLGCDSRFEASFTNSSSDADLYEWTFGDGSTSYDIEPSHTFSDFGSYVVTLKAFDSACQKFNIITDTVTFADTTIAPDPVAQIAECGDGSIDIFLREDRDRYLYKWDFGNGNISYDKVPDFNYAEPGDHIVRLSIQDTSCHKSYDYEYPITIENIGREIFIPNAFSPNGDGLNDSFEIYGNHCSDQDEIRVFNRWGDMVFHTKKPFEEFWDAKQNGEAAPMGVYTYMISNGPKIIRGTVTVFR